MQIIAQILSTAESQLSKARPSKSSACSRIRIWDSGWKILDETVRIIVNSKLDLALVYANVYSCGSSNPTRQLKCLINLFCSRFISTNVILEQTLPSIPFKQILRRRPTKDSEIDRIVLHRSTWRRVLQGLVAVGVGPNNGSLRVESPV